MRNIKVVYQYDGTNFKGFQRQPDQRTVQGELERGLFKILKEKVNLISSGRTDRGVHATMQVSNFETNSTIPPRKLSYALDNITGRDIKVVEAQEVDEKFHSRFSAKKRTYKFLLGWNLSLFERNYVTEVEGKIIPGDLEKIMEIYLGTHNFDSFRMTDCNSKNPVREILGVKCNLVRENKVEVIIEGNAFLKTQIRIMVGSAIAVYFGKVEKDYIDKKLGNPDIKGKKIVIEGKGLYLEEITY